MFPANQPSKVVIKTKNGKEYSEYLEYPKGDPREPMTIEDLDNKFSALSLDLFGEEKHKEIKDVIFSCEEIDTKEFISKLII